MERVSDPHPKDARLCLAYIGVAFVALFLGALAGLLQVLQRTGMIELPAGIGYYQLLTAHGVLLALVLTTYFIIGFFLAGVAKTLGGRLTVTARKLGWVGFWMMTVGTALATYAIVVNKGTVLYTFYAPLQASPSFYVGTALLVVGSWISGGAIFLQYRHWKQATGKKLSPLFAYMTVVTYLIWIIATLGVVAEVVLQLIPWSFGWVERINVLL
ncbi:MAG: cbb3-type cytochrome c oxidase subunit I, partial [Calditerricola sp.]|nr:cbb3-type cytochrome c oxidase subunit I [Calditerricola sp.]